MDDIHSRGTHFLFLGHLRMYNLHQIDLTASWNVYFEPVLLDPPQIAPPVVCLLQNSMVLMKEGVEFPVGDRGAILFPGTLQVSLLQQLFLSPVIIQKRVFNIHYLEKTCINFMFTNTKSDILQGCAVFIV